MGSGFRTFAESEVLTAGNVNNYLMTQSVMYFATTAARDTAITSPVKGMTAYVGSSDSSEGLWTYTGANWRKGPSWNAPWGLIATTAGGTSSISYANVTAAQTTITSPVALTGMGMTFTSPGNRLYRVNVHCNFYGSVAGSTAAIYLIGNTFTISSSHSATLTTSSTDLRTLELSRTFVPAAGAVTMSVSATIQSGTGNVTLQASSTSPASIVIEDIGPFGAPT